MDDLPPIEIAPACYLEGRSLGSGWTVGPRITRDPSATGGVFSVSYTAQREDGQTAFVKALNFHQTDDDPTPFVDRINLFTSAYIFERDLLKDCCSRKMSRVIRLLDYGEVKVPEASPLLQDVPFLILELAEGDIRAFQARSSGFDCAWAFRVLHHALLGIAQLHGALAAHQDLKPSNVLTQNDGAEMKLGDLGRADKKGVEGPWSSLGVPGALAYAPPEQLYDAFERSWEERRAADLYLAGSLGIQLFLGNSMTALVQSALLVQCGWQNWGGTYQEVLPYVRSAQSDIILTLEQNVLQRTADEEIAERFAMAIGQMTDPDPTMRGHPKDHSAAGSSYSVQRFVSLMDVLSAKARRITLGAGELG